MRIISLHITGTFKNLSDFEVSLDDDSPLDSTATTVVLGRNGTGKSNLLEALILIFRNLDLDMTPPFAYHMTYLCRGNEISIFADPELEKREQTKVKVDGADIPYKQFRQAAREQYLPSYVFGYYSGPSNRMETHFEAHQKRFYDQLISKKANSEPPMRPLLYARLVHSHFALLAFFNEQDPDIQNFLKEELGIDGMESVLFVMRKPSWNSKDGDARFWKARGVVRDFLDRLYSLSATPMRQSRSIRAGLKGKQTLEHLYLYLPSQGLLNELYTHYDSQQDFFKALESTYISEILSEVRIRVRIRKADGSLTFRDLSEGEQQLLMVLGLLRFTKEDEALFLLDEPDTHLNPTWGIQYLDFINRVAGTQKSHILISTHNPLVISSLEKGQVRIMQRSEETGRVTANEPDESPRGMGVDSILMSDLFGLRSTLDTYTQNLVDERRELALFEGDLNEQQKQRLGELNEELDRLDFSIPGQDPLYHDFVIEMTRREDPTVRQSITLTVEQREQQRKLTKEILQEIREKRQREHEV